MKKIIVFTLMILSLTACIYPFEADLSDSIDNRLVIDGDIIIGGETSIAVSRLSPLSGMLPSDRRYPTVSVCVESKGGSSIYGYPVSTGRYNIETSQLDPEGTYRLAVSNLEDGKRYVTPWQKVYKSPVITSMFHELSADAADMCLSVELPEGIKHFKVTFEETWEYSADFRPDWMYDPEADTGDDPEDPSKIYRKPYSYEDYYYCWSASTTSEYQLASVDGLSSSRIEKLVYRTMPRTSPKVSIMYSALVSLWPLSSEGYSFYDNMQKTSNESGSLFSPVPSNVRGNIRCESDTTEFVIGFVTVCQLGQERFFLDCEKEKIYKKNYDPESLLFIPEADEDGKYNFKDHYLGDERPVYTKVRDDDPSKTNMYWAPIRCTDCRAGGGSKSKPSYWPNDHE